METELAKDIRVSDVCAQYDAHAKNILGNRIILAWILRYTVDAFSHLPPEDILLLIEGEPRIGDVPVYAPFAERTGRQGKPAILNKGFAQEKGIPEKITGSATEHKVPDEGVVYFDICFNAFLPNAPGRRKPVKIILNVEAQRDFYPGYCFESRGVFYCSRMISAQTGREFAEPHYNDIKKVYSIWLCMNAPRYIGNAISEYKFCKSDILQGMPNRKHDYDKQSVILICLNENVASDNKLICMLNTVFSQTLDFKTKKEILETVYGIPMERKMEKEVSLMCNLSEGILERGLKTGRRQGRKQGRREGRKQGHREARELFVTNMLLDGTISDEQILQFSGISPQRLSELKLSLSQTVPACS